MLNKNIDSFGSILPGGLGRKQFVHPFYDELIKKYTKSPKTRYSIVKIKWNIEILHYFIALRPKHYLTKDILQVQNNSKRRTIKSYLEQHFEPPPRNF